MADVTPELITSAGPGGSPLVHVLELMRDTEISFAPFGNGFGGGIHVATGDLNGDGHAEVLTSQEQGGELKAWEIIDVFSGVNVFTPPAPQPGQANRR